jgi:sec-independent protein translocase protein TatA
MFGISGEHLVILVVILVFLGPKRLPGVAQSLGKAMRNFRDGLSGIPEASYRKIDGQGAPQQPPTHTQSRTDSQAPETAENSTSSGDKGSSS